MRRLTVRGLDGSVDSRDIARVHQRRAATTEAAAPTAEPARRHHDIKLAGPRRRQTAFVPKRHWSGRQKRCRNGSSFALPHVFECSACERHRKCTNRICWRDDSRSATSQQDACGRENGACCGLVARNPQAHDQWLAQRRKRSWLLRRSLCHCRLHRKQNCLPCF